MQMDVQCIRCMLKTVTCYAIETAIRFAAVQLANSGLDVVSSDLRIMRLAKLLRKQRIVCDTNWLRIVARLVYLDLNRLDICWGLVKLLMWGGG